MSTTTAEQIARLEKIHAIENETNEQLGHIQRQIGQPEGCRARATQNQKDDIDICIRDLKRRSARLGDAFLESVSKVLDLDGLLRDLNKLTKQIKKEAEKIGTVAKFLESAGAIVGLADSSIKLFKDAEET